MLEFEREINTVDLSKVVLTHHHLRKLGSKTLDLNQAEKDKVQQEEIIAKLNDLFSGDLSDSDKVIYGRSTRTRR